MGIVDLAEFHRDVEVDTFVPGLGWDSVGFDFSFAVVVIDIVSTNKEFVCILTH